MITNDYRAELRINAVHCCIFYLFDWSSEHSARSNFKVSLVTSFEIWKRKRKMIVRERERELALIVCYFYYTVQDAPISSFAATHRDYRIIPKFFAFLRIMKLFAKLNSPTRFKTGKKEWGGDEEKEHINDLMSSETLCWNEKLFDAENCLLFHLFIILNFLGICGFLHLSIFVTLLLFKHSINMQKESSLIHSIETGFHFVCFWFL